MSFFANKTIGGERARIAIMQKIEAEDNITYGNSSNRNSNPILTNGPSIQSLDRLYKTFSDNQNRLEAILGSHYDVGG